MEASTSNGPDDVKTFRGRSLEELLPQIRAELGPDAIVLRRREGRDEKAGGFFQRPFVEVDARAPHADERPLEIRSDRATAEGLSSPGRPGPVRAGDAVRRRARRRGARHAHGGRHVLRELLAGHVRVLRAPAGARGGDPAPDARPRASRSRRLARRPVRPAAERVRDRGRRAQPPRRAGREPTSRRRAARGRRARAAPPAAAEPGAGRRPSRRPGRAVASARRPARPAGVPRPPSADAAEERLIAGRHQRRARGRRGRRGRRPRPALLRAAEHEAPRARRVRPPHPDADRARPRPAHDRDRRRRRRGQVLGRRAPRRDLRRRRARRSP